MKAPDCLETPLMAAFRAAQGAADTIRQIGQSPFDYWRTRNAFAVSYAQLSALRKPCH
jgi:hypothetical protein